MFRLESQVNKFRKSYAVILQCHNLDNSIIDWAKIKFEEMDYTLNDKELVDEVPHLTLLTLEETSELKFVLENKCRLSELNLEIIKIINKYSLNYDFYFKGIKALGKFITLELKDDDLRLHNVCKELSELFANKYKMKIRTEYKFIPHITLGISHSGEVYSSWLNDSFTYRRLNSEKVSFSHCKISCKHGAYYKAPIEEILQVDLIAEDQASEKLRCEKIIARSLRLFNANQDGVFKNSYFLDRLFMEKDQQINDFSKKHEKSLSNNRSQRAASKYKR